MTEIQTPQTGSRSARGISEQSDNGRFEHSDIRILYLFRISDFVHQICNPLRPELSLGHLASGPEDNRHDTDDGGTLVSVEDR